jgi:hypothetical protein
MKDKLILSRVFDNNYVKFRIDSILNELATLHINKDKDQHANHFIAELKELSNQTNDQEDIINIAFALMDCYFATNSTDNVYDLMLNYEDKIIDLDDDMIYFFYKEMFEKMMKNNSYENALQFYKKAKEYLFKCDEMISEEYGDLASSGALIFLHHNYNDGLTEVERILNDENSHELTNMDRSNIYHTLSLFKTKYSDLQGAEEDKLKSQYFLERCTDELI